MAGPPDRRYDVDISGGKGAVVGDYATVFQVFAESPPLLASFMRVAQFRALVDERTKGFVGRDFVFDRLDRLIAGEEFESGYAIIRGEPGIGKTAIAATLVARRGYVHHFNIAPDNVRTARQFLENVCAQLIVRFDLEHATLPPQATEDAGFLSQLLIEAVDRAGRPLVVVVDAMDEVDDAGLPIGANRLYLPRVLPRGVFFIVTSREEADYQLNVDNQAEIWIRESDPQNREDVGRYIRAFVAAHADVLSPRLAEWGIDEDAFVDELAERSEGNFMYLVYVLPDIAVGRLTRTSVGEISALPRGLRSYYDRHWREMKDADPERFSTFQRPVLCLLAISREAVTVEQLMQWTGLEPGDIADVIREWREFLNEDAGRFRIYHRSFAEFLDDVANLRYYHDKIAQSAIAKIPGFSTAREADDA